MCGRYVVKNPVTKTNKIVKSAIQVEDTENYNAHPYQKLPVIKKYKNGNTLENLQWGLVPGWAKDKDFKALINARLETIDEKVSFKKLIKNNRCVAVADGFYEWKREEKEKTPNYFTRKDTNTIYLAAIFIIAWFVVFIISKYSSLASMVASLLVPLSSYFFLNDINYYFYIILFLLILITHRENIKRLKNNTESKTKIY